MEVLSFFIIEQSSNSKSMEKFLVGHGCFGICQLVYTMQFHIYIKKTYCTCPGKGGKLQIDVFSEVCVCSKRQINQQKVSFNILQKVSFNIKSVCLPKFSLNVHKHLREKNFISQTFPHVIYYWI